MNVKLIISLIFVHFITSPNSYAQNPYQNYGTHLSSLASQTVLTQNYPQQLSQQSPAELLELGVQYIQNFIKNGSVDDKELLFQFLDQQVAPFFDFEQMARWVGGYQYNMMNSAQQYIFTNKLKKLFFTSFARIVSAYGDKQPRLVFLPARKRGYNEVIVSARIYPSRGYTIKVDFRFLKGPKGWKIYDVGTNGNSAVSYFRTYFNNLVRTYGINALIQ